MRPVVVGVLALQGAFAKHIEALKKLGVQAVEVRKPEELEGIDALIIPGGESTTIMKQMNFIKFVDGFREFAKTKPVFGTCAGLILMSQEIVNDWMKPFNLINVAVERNAFGRQVESFHTKVDLDTGLGKPHLADAVFIRAPRIRRVGSGVKVLATYEGEPVLVQQGRHLGATFHPELTSDTSIHAYFLSLIEKVK